MTKEKRKVLLISLLSVAVLTIIFFLALLIGRYSVSLESFWKVMTGNDSVNNVDKSVILTLRLPRTIVALLVGIALILEVCNLIFFITELAFEAIVLCVPIKNRTTVFTIVSLQFNGSFLT